ncbi:MULTISPECIES: hypothetical protein [Antarcticibacterium]|uniref:hypothetical protein n=1 Tax=Antarcticibacterium TaxID=2058174 RepID=UPI00143D00F4|nr:MULTISPECIES: hypothetical protein [Antarcticibacterium]
MKIDIRLLYFLLFLGTGNLAAQNLYELPKENPVTRWISFENLSGQKGAGG